jgi:hypothetical protein
MKRIETVSTSVHWPQLPATAQQANRSDRGGLFCVRRFCPVVHASRGGRARNQFILFVFHGTLALFAWQRDDAVWNPCEPRIVL